MLQSRPTGLEWSYPEGSGLRAERRAEEENRKIIRQSTIDNWVPWFVLENGRGELVQEGTLTTCNRIYHPTSNSGLRMLNVVTIDLETELVSPRAHHLGAGRWANGLFVNNKHVRRNYRMG